MKPQTTHTPGPWTLGFADDKRAYVNAGGITICKCDGGGDVGERRANPLANAHLIAAAPEMLDILKAVAVLADAVDLFAGNETIAAGVRAAIAKTEGAHES